jgi:hypothetical protein
MKRQVVEATDTFMTVIKGTKVMRSNYTWDGQPATVIGLYGLTLGREERLPLYDFRVVGRGDDDDYLIQHGRNSWWPGAIDRMTKEKLFDMLTVKLYLTADECWAAHKCFEAEA